MGANKITIPRGDTRQIRVTVTDSSGAVFNLTGYTMQLTVKSKSSDTDSNAIIGPITATVSDPNTGIGTFAVTSTHTNIRPGVYVYDVQINNGSSDVKTVIGPDDFEIVADVTRGEA